MSNRPHSRQKKTVNKKVEVFKKQPVNNSKGNRPSPIRAILGSLIKK